MGFPAGHDDHFSRPETVRFTGDEDLGFAVQDADQRVEGRRMFAQSLIPVKGEQGNRPGRFPDDLLADNGAVLVRNQIRHFECLFSHVFLLSRGLLDMPKMQDNEGKDEKTGLFVRQDDSGTTRGYQG